MSKNSKLGCTALAILFVIVSVIVFVVPIEKTPAVWIAYTFTCVAFAAQIIIWKIGFKDKALKSKFLGIPIIRVGFIYLVLQLIALAVFFVIPKAPEWIVIIVCILILGISSVCMISSEIGRNIIENTEKKVDAKVSYIREIQADIEMCAERETDPEIKNQLLDLAEKVRYSDPMSSESLATIENKIVNKISELDTSDNKQAVIKEIDLLITERNKKANLTNEGTGRIVQALTCDICGGKLKIGKGKIAVCDSCGMEHSFSRLQEKIQEIKGTVHVDTAHLTDNYYSIALDAYNADNFSVAETYCDKILENTPNHTRALLLKGKAVGWQSNLSHMRFKESVICFANAVNCLYESEISASELETEIEDELKNLATALIKVRTDRFEKWLDIEETNGFYSDLDEMNSAIEIYERETSIKANRNYIFSNVSSIVYNSISIISLTILLKYKLDGSKEAYQTFLNKTDNCVRILEKTADLCDDDDSSDLKIYKLIVSMIQSVIDNNTTDYQGDRWGAYTEVPRLSKASENIKREKIKSIQNKIKKINL